MNERIPIVLSRDEVRAIDAAAVAELGISSMVLMENAARGVCDFLLRHLAIDQQPTRPTVIVCGPGNNGGDGLALARQLQANGLPVNVQLVRGGRALSLDAEQNLSILHRSGTKTCDNTEDGQLLTNLLQLSEQDVVVDCLLGTGVRGAPTEPFASAIRGINSTSARVLAVDAPSGLDCHRGIVEGDCVNANHTITFVAQKTGFLSPQAAEFTGEIAVAHIGLPAHWVERWLANRRHK